MQHPTDTAHENPTNDGPASLVPVAWPDDPPVIPLRPPPPWWVWLVGAGAALALLVSISVASAADAPVDTEVVAAPAPAPAAPAEPADDPDLYALALEGEAPALDRLESMPAEVRSVTDVLVLAEGRRARDLRDVRALARESGWETRDEDRRRIASFARRADTGAETLGIVATSGGAAGADLIFAVWRGAPKGSPLSLTAAQLLMSPTVRAQSSPALRVAVELQRVTECSAAAELVQEADRVADRRALRGLARLTRRDGCGADSRGDCFACLRSGKDLGRALRSVARRAEPRM